MRLRVLLEPHHGATYAQILALAKAAEEGGFDAFFRSDHYLGIDADDTTYEPTDSWTTLAGLGVQTSRVRLGTLVNASTFRLPGQLAVEVATVDQMSGGRAELGIGAAWYEREHQYFGIPFPAAGGALRPARRATGDPHRHLGHQAGRAVQLRRQVLPGHRTAPASRGGRRGRRSSSAAPASSGPRPWPRGTPTSSTAPSASTCASGTRTSGASARTWSAATRRRCGCPPPSPCASAPAQADLERRKESLGAPGARLLAAGVTGHRRRRDPGDRGPGRPGRGHRLLPPVRPRRRRAHTAARKPGRQQVLTRPARILRWYGSEPRWSR